MTPTKDRILAALPDASVGTRANGDVLIMANNGVIVDVPANADWINRLLDWKLNSPRELKRRGAMLTAMQGGAMQRQYTIELRVDYADEDKKEALKAALQHAARHVLATASLITDSGMKPQISIFSDDWFSGFEEIALLDDTIQQGLDEMGQQAGNDEQVDPELLKAMAELPRGAS